MVEELFAKEVLNIFCLTLRRYERVICLYLLQFFLTTEVLPTGSLIMLFYQTFCTLMKEKN